MKYIKDKKYQCGRAERLGLSARPDKEGTDYFFGDPK